MSEGTNDPARARFFTIQAMRWLGLAFVLVGLLIVKGKIGLPAWAGYLCIINGLFDALILPTILARRWKSPPR